MGKFRNDLTGKKFGHLTAISFEGSRYWLCKCDCGVEKLVRSENLRSGKAKSCGCMRGAKKRFLGCEEDCFHCPYPDCMKTSGFKPDREVPKW